VLSHVLPVVRRYVHSFDRDRQLLNYSFAGASRQASYLGASLLSITYQATQ
jgi:hypothetical protein